MNIEIERKFLVAGEAWRSLGRPVRCRQGYLNSEPNRTVRVRTTADGAWLTVKGRADGPRRTEFQYEIPLQDAELLLKLCEQPWIEKDRYRIVLDDLVWEVDEFCGENAGLVLAEVELVSEDQEVPLPEWVGQEVTGDPRFFNSSLVSTPYRTWS